MKIEVEKHFEEVFDLSLDITILITGEVSFDGYEYQIEDVELCMYSFTNIPTGQTVLFAVDFGNEVLDKLELILIEEYEKKMKGFKQSHGCDRDHARREQ